MAIPYLGAWTFEYKTVMRLKFDHTTQKWRRFLKYSYKLYE